MSLENELDCTFGLTLWVGKALSLAYGSSSLRNGLIVASECGWELVCSVMKEAFMPVSDNSLHFTLLLGTHRSYNTETLDIFSFLWVN